MKTEKKINAKKRTRRKLFDSDSNYSNDEKMFCQNRSGGRIWKWWRGLFFLWGIGKVGKPWVPCKICAILNYEASNEKNKCDFSHFPSEKLIFH